MVDKRNPHTQPFDMAVRRKSFGFGNTQINRKEDINCVNRLYGEYSDPPRLDPAADGGGTGCDQSAFAAVQNRLVIGNQSGPHRHQLQSEARLARARGADDHHAAPRVGHRRSVDRQVAGWRRHTGRPTTKRAPSGSEVMSASVGRMFSAQITPPCASTICFEMASPSPECSPNWPGGRSE